MIDVSLPVPRKEEIQNKDVLLTLCGVIFSIDANMERLRTMILSHDSVDVAVVHKDIK